MTVEAAPVDDMTAAVSMVAASSPSVAVTTAVATDMPPVREGRPRRAGPLAGPLAAAPLLLPRAALEGASAAEGPWLVTAVATTVVTRPGAKQISVNIQESHTAHHVMHASADATALVVPKQIKSRAIPLWVSADSRLHKQYLYLND